MPKYLFTKRKTMLEQLREECGEEERAEADRLLADVVKVNEYMVQTRTKRKQKT